MENGSSHNKHLLVPGTYANKLVFYRNISPVSFIATTRGTWSWSETERQIRVNAPNTNSLDLYPVPAPNSLSKRDNERLHNTSDTTESNCQNTLHQSNTSPLSHAYPFIYRYINSKKMVRSRNDEMRPMNVSVAYSNSPEAGNSSRWVVEKPQFLHEMLFLPSVGNVANDRYMQRGEIYFLLEPTFYQVLYFIISSEKVIWQFVVYVVIIYF